MNYFKAFFSSGRGLSQDVKLICISEFLFFFGDGLFTFLLPVYIRQLDASATDVGLLYAFYYLSNGLSVLAGGFLADRFDRKKIIIFSSLIWIPVPLMMLMATSWSQMLLPMILYGAYFCAPAVSVHIAKSSAEHRYMFAYGMWSASTCLGYVFSPSLGGFIASSIGMHIVFLLSFAFFLASMFPLFFIRTQQTEENKISAKSSTEKTSNMTRLIILACFFSTAMFFYNLLNPLVSQFTNEVYGQSLLNIGIFGVATSMGGFFFSLTLGHIGDKLSRINAIAFSLLISACSFLLMITLNNFATLFVASFLAGAFGPFLYLMVGLVASLAPHRFEGRWVSVVQTSVTLTTFGAPLVGGLLYEFSSCLPFYVFIIAMLCLAVVAWIASKHFKQ